ncbi:peptidoglycan binding domain-containing protein [Nonomuraea helvata]|uniref:Peptidoglycan binding domain-containing protein n=1 Tax=Nonomuraea helvata TaxID=37484 RepID=A0ABV5SF92_9ACTN
MTRPSITADEVRRVVASTARTAVEAPLTLAGGGKKATVSREQLATGLRFVSDRQGSLRASYDASKISAGVAKALLITPPKDASFKIVNNRPRLVPSRAGHGVDIKALGPAISKAVATGSRRVDLPATERQPRVTTAEAKKLGVKEKVSSFTSRYPCCAPPRDQHPSHRRHRRRIRGSA